MKRQRQDRHALLNFVRSAANVRFLRFADLFKIVLMPHSHIEWLEAQLHKINTGKVFFMRDEPNLNLVTQELRQFPNGRYDDFVDSFTQALSQMGVSSGTPTWRIS